jgi:signal transduction histidine kinase
MAKREPFWSKVLTTNASPYLLLTVVAVLILVNLYQAGWQWWLAIGLLIALGGLYGCWWPKCSYYLYLAVETVLVVTLAWLESTAALLGFSLSVHAMVLLPGRIGALWIVCLTLIIGAQMLAAEGLVDGLLWMMVYGAGYASFGMVYYSWSRTEVARSESQALLADLREAHRQLQEYAARVEELAVAEERNRLAREMHDTLGHRLTVAAVQLEGAQRLIPSDPERAVHMVGTVRDQVREALGELRRTVATLRTPLEADLSLPAALTRLATGFELATGLTVHLALPEDVPDLPDAHRLALYRASQEGLTNVQRHAQARDVRLQLAWQDGVVTLVVDDNGVGGPVYAEQAGFGLRGLRERAAQLDGELALESRPGGGTRLSFRLPLPAEESDG